MKFTVNSNALTYRLVVLLCGSVVWAITPVAQGGSVTVYEYDDNGDQTRTVMESLDGNIEYSAETVAYDNLGRQASITKATGVHDMISEYVYDGWGNIATKKIHTSGSPLLTVYEYDDYGQQVTVQGPSTNLSSPGCPEVVYKYDLAGGVTKQQTKIDSTYATVETLYDDAGRVTKVIDPQGHYRETVYDSHGRSIREYAKNSSNAVLTQTRTEYDRLGRVKRRIRFLDADTASGAQPETDNIVEYVYDIGGRVLTQTTYNMNSSTPIRTVNEYDARGRLTKTTNPEGLSSTVAYDDTKGLRDYSVDYSGRTNWFKYDDSERLTKSIIEGTTQSITTSYEYDGIGRQTRVIAPPDDNDHSTETEYKYDKAGRKTLVTEDEGTGGAGRITEYHYSKQGALTRLVAQNKDSNGTALPSQTTIYALDSEGRVASVTYPDGDSISFTYDRTGKVNTRTDQDSQVLQYYYDDRGLLLTKKDTANAKLFATYSYDGLGRLVTARKGVTSAYPMAHSNTVYWYDDLSRVTKEEQSVLGGSANVIQREFDQVGNVILLEYPNP